MSKPKLRKEHGKVSEQWKKLFNKQATRGVKKTGEDYKLASQYKLINFYVNSDWYIVDPVNFEPYIGSTFEPITKEMFDNAIDRICEDYKLTKMNVGMIEEEEREVITCEDNALVIPTFRDVTEEYSDIYYIGQFSNVFVVDDNEKCLWDQYNNYYIGREQEV